METNKRERRLLPMPGWTLVLFMALYGELILHIWTNDPVLPGRLLAVCLFAAGFGGILAFLTSLIPGKAQKWTAIVLGFLLAVMYLTWYFINESFKVFMNINTILSGAEGVANGFLDTVLVLLARDWWRIAIFLAPLILFGIFAGHRTVSWKTRGILAGITVILYALSMASVKFVSGDMQLFRDAYNFDSAVHAFGLNVSLVLDEFAGSSDASESFEQVEPVPVPTEETQPQEEAGEPQEPEIVYEPNAIYDFDTLAETCGNQRIANIHNYVGSQTPTLKNEYTGLFKGKNLIIISAEAFSAEVIDKDRTPTLYRMANQGIQFLDYYQPMWGGGTSAGEFANLMGFPGFGKCMMEVRYQDFFLDMGFQLDRLGYASAAFHNNDWKFYRRDMTHFKLGYDTYMGYGNGMEKGVQGVWPQSDLEMMEFTIPQFIDGDQPFNLYYMSVSGPSLYSQKSNAMARKNYDVVKDLPCSEEVKCYLAANHELERAMEYVVGELEKRNMEDDTVIVIAADHYPYDLERSSTWGNAEDRLSELYGKPCTDDFTRDHNRLIIWSGCLEDSDLDLTVEEPTSSLDILPTLSNLFGLEYDSRLLVGRDVFSDAMPLVLWNNYNWKTDKGTYDPSKHEFVPAEGAEIPEGYVDWVSSIVKNKHTYARSVMEAHYFNYVPRPGDPDLPPYNP